jgi:hypothetical protein
MYSRRINYTTYPYKFYILSEQYLQTIKKIVSTEQIIWIDRTNKLYALNKFYKLPEQILQTIILNSTNYQNKNLYSPNKLYEPMKKMYTHWINSTNYRTNLTNYKNKFYKLLDQKYCMHRTNYTSWYKNYARIVKISSY